jgi:hypothetical protein
MGSRLIDGLFRSSRYPSAGCSVAEPASILYDTSILRYLDTNVNSLASLANGVGTAEDDVFE